GHVAAAALMVPAAAATGLSPPVAALAGALFAVHPIHTEAVAHVASRGSVLGTALVLVALLWWRRERSLLHELGALGACAAALPGVQSLAGPGALVGLFSGVALAVLASGLWARHRVAFFWMACAVLTYGVVSNIPFPTDTIFHEDLLYLPSAGVCALAALAVA